MHNAQTDPGTPWQLCLERDGTEDYLVIREDDGDELVRSRFFWMPEEGDPVPRTLVATWLMYNAPPAA